MNLRPLLATSLIALVAFGCVSCSSSDTDTPGTTADAATPPAGTDIHVTNFKFSPATVTIKAGDTVTWKFDEGTHNVVSGADCTSDGVYTSGDPKAAPNTFARAFPTAGTFNFFCLPHCGAGMKGTITVQ